MTADDKTAHHHGDLKNALIFAGLEILQEGGLDALSLRKCAARAGVSHAAPAHHFKNLDGLKAAIATKAFEMFAAQMRESAQAEGHGADAYLRGICRGYLQFGLRHRGLLDVLFGLPAETFVKVSNYRDTSSSYDILRRACAPYVPDGTRPELIETQVWSLIHGFTLLYVSGRFGDLPSEDADKGLFDQVMTLLKGLGPARS